MYEHANVLHELQGHLAVVTLNSADTGNALSIDMLHELREILLQVTASDAHAILLVGAGRNFSLGADRADLADFAKGSRESLGEAMTLLADVFRRIHETQVPTLAAVQGQAAGAGFSLALACDLRIAAESARFNFAYAALGASPDGGMTWLLPRIVGWARSQELLLEQPLIRSKQAMAEGLVNAVVPGDELLERARQFGKLLASQPTHSMRSVKELIRSSEGVSLGDHMKAENSLFIAGLDTEYMRDILATKKDKA